MKKLLASLVVLGLVACSDSLTQPEVAPTDTPSAVPAPQLNGVPSPPYGALVFNYGRNGSPCGVVAGSVIYGYGHNTQVINYGGVFIYACVGDWLAPPPPQAVNTGIGGCPAGFIGRLTITPGARFKATCTPE